jgi:N-acetylneuraminate synthase
MINLIAEIGINHIADMKIVEKMIKISALAGFNFVKFQKRNPDISTPDHMKNVMRKTPWGEMTYLEYRHRMEFSEADYEHINYICERENIGWFASVWDMDSAKFMCAIDKVDLVKIPSAKITDYDLLIFCRENFHRVMISTGMSTEQEIDRAVAIGHPDIIMHSVACYPTIAEESHLDYLRNLQRHIQTGKEIGYSGHEEGIDLALVAMPLGIKWIEKHITLDRNMWGSDQKFSIEPSEIFTLAKKVRQIEKGLIPIEERILFDCEKDKKEQLRG